MGNFIFNGVSAADMGLVVERIPSQYSPRKRITSYTIPGRSGNLHQWDGAWENVPQRYLCWFKAAPVSTQAHKIKQWLHTAPAGARLEDTYDDTVYHLATYAGGADIENVRDRYGRFVLEFDCDPRAFLKSGDSAQNITGTAQLDNQTPFTSNPLIEVDSTGKAGGTVKIGEYSINFYTVTLPAATVYVDCDIREAWYFVDGEKVSCNQVITSPNWPVIEPGSNIVTLSGVGITAARIYPRWWTL